MPGYKLLNGTKGIFNAMKYEIAKEPGIEPNLKHLNSILQDNKGINETTLNKIIELSEK